MVPSTRFGLAFVMFFGCLFSYAMRTNMSMAIVCMVAPDNSTDSNKTSKCVSASSLDKDEDEKPAVGILYFLLRFLLFLLYFEVYLFILYFLKFIFR